MKISVLGALGSVGAPVAFNIALSGVADEILLIDLGRHNVLEHHALDIQTAASLCNVTVRAGNYKDLPGSDVVINVAGAHLPLTGGRQDRLQEQTRFVRDIALKLSNYCADAIIITAVNPVDTMNYVTYLTGGFDRRKLIGYSINDTIRFRETLAKELHEEVPNVDGLVIGEHGSTQVPLFSSVKMGGASVVVADDVKQRIRFGMFDMIRRFESLKAGRTAGWTCAVGFATIVRAIAEDHKTVLPCSIVLSGEYGLSDISMSVPVILGRGGVKEILEYEMSPDEREGLRASTEVLQSDAVVARDALTTSLDTTP